MDLAGLRERRREPPHGGGVGLDAVFSLPTTVEVVRLGCGVLLHGSGGGGARRLPWMSTGLVLRQGALVLPR